MKHLFFVSVAMGIFSGTSISSNAQTAVNTVKVDAAQKKSVQFIEGIEIKRESRVATETDVWAAPVNKTVPSATKVAYKKTAGVNALTIENCSGLQFKYAQLLDMDVESFSNSKLYESIEAWWATRYRYGGTTKKGIDCSALTGALMNEAFGYTLARTARDQFAQCEKVDKENLEEGDLVFFNTRGGISHVGVYLGNNYFVHASVHSGVTINSLNDDYYSRKYIGGGRVMN
jgi:murein DD-endopeptidase / murein LD-carboxypeptidase